MLRTDDTYFTGRGLERWRHSDTLDGAAALVETRYDAYDRVSQRSQPYYSGGSVFWTSYLYDVIGRPTQEDAPVEEGTPTGRITTIAYEGRDVKVTDPLGHITTRTQTVLGSNVWIPIHAAPEDKDECPDHLFFTTADVIIGSGVMWGTRLMPVLPMLTERESYSQYLESRPAWQRTGWIFEPGGASS